MVFGTWDDDDDQQRGSLQPTAAVAYGNSPSDDLAQASSPTSGKLTAGFLEPRYEQFFAKNYPYAAQIAGKYGVDPTLLLGVAALESGYGTNSDATKRNNPLGLRPDGRTPIAFPSIQAAWDEWGREWGPRVLGVGGDVGTFLDQLQQDNRTLFGPTRGGDYRGPYNSEQFQPGEKSWKERVPGTIAGVRKRLPLWQGSPDDTQ